MKKDKIARSVKRKKSVSTRRRKIRKREILGTSLTQVRHVPIPDEPRSKSIKIPLYAIGISSLILLIIITALTGTNNRLPDYMTSNIVSPQAEQQQNTEPERIETFSDFVAVLLSPKYYVWLFFIPAIVITIHLFKSIERWQW